MIVSQLVVGLADMTMKSVVHKYSLAETDRIISVQCAADVCIPKDCMAYLCHRIVMVWL